MERRIIIDDYEPGPVPSGFVKQELTYSADGLTKARSAYEREERRVRKWRKIIGVGGSDWKHYVRRKSHVVKRRIRKGIPDCLRGLVWQLISGSWDLLLMNHGVYEKLLKRFDSNIKRTLALLKYCHDDLVKLPFEKLIHALHNFLEHAMDPDTLLPLAYSIKVSRPLEEQRQKYEKRTVGCQLNMQS